MRSDALAAVLSFSGLATVAVMLALKKTGFLLSSILFSDGRSIRKKGKTMIDPKALTLDTAAFTLLSPFVPGEVKVAS